ncbi:hypothetical protein ACJJV6_16560 [Arthrobacter nitrophenolicus]|jgi:hypothetical protein|uniref:Uncharacterized protein n=1 Tax=Arthrobacter nitrophenolicus TaxID=683150 RepID=A0ACC6TKU0_9MICC|nr:hypothetical protein [Arthrobacter nitrophenolicus]
MTRMLGRSLLVRREMGAASTRDGSTGPVLIEYKLGSGGGHAAR